MCCFSIFLRAKRRTSLDMGKLAFWPRRTTSNTQRKRELEKWFEDVKYDNGHNTLRMMLEDAKAKALLDDRYGYLWGDATLHFSVLQIPSCSLVPTKPTLDLNQSLLPALTDPKKLEQLFIEPIVVNKPVITFRGNYVIDGHQSWIQATAFRPEQRIIALDYDGSFSPIQFMRIIQKAIEEDDKNAGKRPPETKDCFNLFSKEVTVKDIKDYIVKNITKETIACCVERIEECMDDVSTIDWIVANLSRIKHNNCPETS